MRISSTLGTRTPKQCRERYHQNLKPSLNHEPITHEEGLLIERLVLELGKRWAEIARRLHGRSDNAVKNWWNGSQNRRKRHDKRRSTTQTSYDERSEQPSYDRSQMSIPRTLPIPSSRPHPAPLQFSSYHDSRYIDSPLSSPSTYTPDSELAPSLMSDVGSHYYIATELPCASDAAGLSQVASHYKSLCDPRLTPWQAITAVMAWKNLPSSTLAYL